LKNLLISFIILLPVLSISLLASSQNGYTPQKIKTLAYNYKKVREHRLTLNIAKNPLIFFMSYEFKGYVTGILDNDTSLHQCKKQYSYSEIIYKTAIVISESKLDKKVQSHISTLVAINFACDSSNWSK